MLNTTLRLFAATLMLCSVIYPAVVTGFAAMTADETRHGSVVTDSRGVAVGSKLIAQKFNMPHYFWPRPSAVDYNGSGSGGSNLSPAGPLLRTKISEEINRLTTFPTPTSSPIPSELVYSSGSGLDPHISREGALFQVGRVAKARNVSESVVIQIIDKNIPPHLTSMISEPKYVNVLLLNIALDREITQK